MQKHRVVVAALVMVVLAGCAQSGEQPTSSTVTSSTSSAVSTTLTLPAVDDTPPPAGTGVPLDAEGTWQTFQSGSIDQDIAIDAEGYVWAVGEGGAVRINPETLTYDLYSTDDGLADTFVLKVYAHPDGSVWMQTMSGLSVWRDGVFSAPPWGDGSAPWQIDREANPAMEIAEIDDQGRVWFVGHQSAFAFDGGEWHEYLTSENVNTLNGFAVDTDGGAWMFSWDTLHRSSGQSVAEFALPHEGWGVWDLAAGVDGGVWIAGSDPVYFDSDSYTAYPGAHGRDIEVDNSGGVWMVSEQVFHLVDRSWEAYDVGGWSEALAVRSPTEVWVAHQGRSSVARVLDGEVTVVEVPELERFDNTAIISDGTGQAYAYDVRERTIETFSDDSWAEYPDPPPAFAESILVGDPMSGLWAASPLAGIAYCDGEMWSIVADSAAMPTGQLSAFSVLPSGPAVGLMSEEEQISIGTWNGTGFDLVDLTDVGTYPLPVIYIREGPDGTIWIGTLGELLAVESGSATLAPGGGWRGNQILGMEVDDDGVIWIAHADGLDWLEGDVWSSTYTRNDVQLSIAYGVDVAPNGAVWVAGYGAYRFDGDEWTVLGPSDGVVSRVLMGVDASTDGTVWFVSDKSGLARWTPDP